MSYFIACFGFNLLLSFPWKKLNFFLSLYLKCTSYRQQNGACPFIQPDSLFSLLPSLSYSLDTLTTHTWDHLKSSSSSRMLCPFLFPLWVSFSCYCSAFQFTCLFFCSIYSAVNLISCNIHSDIVAFFSRCSCVLLNSLQLSWACSLSLFSSFLDIWNTIVTLTNSIICYISGLVLMD